MNRREALQSLAALASAAWATEGIDPEVGGPEGGRDEGGCGYFVGEFEPESTNTSIIGGTIVHDVAPDPSILTDHALGVYYDCETVNLDIDGRSGDGISAGSLALLKPEKAREVAVAIYMAAEECEQADE